ncbi:glutamate-rich protein 2 [Plakobranchus ocellatus]|uniref:Glutamate-rich protein 2 n=1 Tax=Plakobranchus ocellatus TaxID=259542 RepID=A0AAV4BMM3_9GAST|nr:glutamate-rich protein 2 [Plakobranchus ocellatus]
MESQGSKRQLQNKKNSNSSNCSTNPSPSPSSYSTKRILKKHSGSLEIIEGDATNLYSPDCEDAENESRPASQGFYRPWSRSSVGSVPPRPDSSSQSRRLVTPSKQISLQTVKRKEESSEPFAPDVDLAALSLDKSYNRAWDFTSFTEEEHSCVSTPKFDSGSDLYAPQHATQLRLPRPHVNSEAAVEHMNSIHEDGAIGGATAALPLSRADSREKLQQAEEKVANNPAARLAHDDNEEEEDDDDDDDDEDDSSEEEERKAPNELLIEFVECLMKKDYENAQKLCKMILLYEPTNPEALKFQPVIEEKLRLDAEAEEEADSNEDDGNDEDEEDDEDDEDDDDSSSNEDEDSDDSDDDDDDDDEDEEEDSIFRAMAEAVSANYYASREDPGTASGSGS